MTRSMSRPPAMTRVHVSLRIPGTAPMPELIKLIQNVETAGFDGAGILDSQLLAATRSSRWRWRRPTRRTSCCSPP
jgi:hypothetical protein